ncbi:hypothetical protein RRK08_000675 [Staphylococcus pseudintermedius]|nr:hypothetical protein [Staphylococcus pseudintermedius]
MLFDLLNDADSLAATDWLLEIDCDFATLADRLFAIDFLTDNDFDFLTEIACDLFAELDFLTESECDFLTEAAFDFLIQLDLFTESECDFAALSELLIDIDCFLDNDIDRLSDSLAATDWLFAID